MSLSSWLLWIVAWGFALFYASINYLNTGTGLPLLFGAMISTLFVVLISVMIARYQPVEQKAQARVRVRRVISGLAAIRTGGPQ
jgi:amino acid transporter